MGGGCYVDFSRGMRCHRVDVPNPNFGGLGRRLSGLITGLSATPMNPAFAVGDLPVSAILHTHATRR